MDPLNFKRLLPLLAVPALSAVSCSLFSFPDGASEPPGQAESGLRICFDHDSVVETKAVSESIDTNSFLLDIRSSGGDVIYSGRYGDSPVSFRLPAGSYTVRAVSAEFRTPAFSSPQYGDEQCVVVPEGKMAGVRLNCTMMNCGVALNVASGFLTQYPKSSLFLKSDDGRLPYSYTERRIAFFRPGKVSLLLVGDAGTKMLVTRSLAAGDVLRLSVKVSGGGMSGQEQPQDGVRIAVDTSKNWISGTFVIGGGSSSGGGGSSGGETSEGVDCAVTISMARELVGETDVWVGGYIVGGDLTPSKASFAPPFKSRSNILLGPRSSADSRDGCLSVQLPEGDVRDGLNLVDNPQMLGQMVLLCGDVVDSYYGMEGLKNVSDFVLK